MRYQNLHQSGCIQRSRTSRRYILKDLLQRVRLYNYRGLLGKFIIHRVASWAGSRFPPQGELFRESTQDRTTVFLSPNLGGNITSLCHILYPSGPQGEGMTQGHIHQVAGIIVAYLRGFLPQAVSSWKGELQCRSLNRRAFLWR